MGTNLSVVGELSVLWDVISALICHPVYDAKCPQAKIHRPGSQGTEVACFTITPPVPLLVFVLPFLELWYLDFFFFFRGFNPVALTGNFPKANYPLLHVNNKIP